MKKIISLVLVAMISMFIFSGCGNNSSSKEPIELVVFAAAAMTESLDEIAQIYKEVSPNVKLRFNYDSSGTLKTQIEQGADCDIFISAAQKQMNQLDIESDKNEEKLDFVLSGTRKNLLENKVVFIVSKDNPAEVNKFTDVATDKVSMVALGNSDMPVGQYTEELFNNLGVWNDIQDKISYGSNVKEIITQVSEGSVDCGVVYATDAYSAGLEVVDTATADMLDSKVLYPVAIMKSCEKIDEAQSFIDFLETDKAKAVFKKVGFVIAE